MKHFGVLVAAALTLSACGDDGAPSGDDIAQFYDDFNQRGRISLIQTYGSKEQVPQAEWAVANTRHEIDITECTDAGNDRGYLCVYDVQIFDIDTGDEVAFSPFTDIEARVYRVSEGWALEEING